MPEDQEKEIAIKGDEWASIKSGYTKCLEEATQKIIADYDKRIADLEKQIERMKRCEICAKSNDWRNRGLCIECEKSKSHINFDLRR